MDNIELQPVKCSCGLEPQIYNYPPDACVIICRKCYKNAYGKTEKEAIQNWNLGIALDSIQLKIKERPMKPIDKRENSGRCPICNYSKLTRECDYCPKCGQRINWGKYAGF